MSDASDDNQGTSTRPYLIRALHDWCTDNGFTPYIAVHVGTGVQVPQEYVKNQEIVLNVGFEATSGLKLGNELIEFRARFGGKPRDLIVPVDHVVAIYARENGQGMAFPAPTPSGAAGAQSGAEEPEPAAPTLRLASSEPQTGAADEESGSHADQPQDDGADDDPPSPEPPQGGTRPHLKRVK